MILRREIAYARAAMHELEERIAMYGKLLGRIARWL
jgi:hypothetical protein